MVRPSLPALENLSATPRDGIAGLAVLEGVLIRSRTGYAAAVRRPDGAIVVHQVPWRPLAARFPVLSLPVLRGMAAMAEFGAVATHGLVWSAEMAEAHTRPAAPQEHRLPSSLAEAARFLPALGALAAGTLLLVLLAVAGPDLLSRLAGAESQAAHDLIAGLWRMALLLAYITLLPLNADVRRVFAWHAAEHQAVRAWEDGAEPEVDEARRRSRLHPRCGTALLMLVAALCLPVFPLATALAEAIAGPLTTFGVWMLHIALLPLLTGVAFELLKVAARNPRHRLSRLVLVPGMALQRLTTRPADDAQREVALIALLAALDIAPEQRQATRWVVRGLHLPPAEAPRVRLQEASA